MIALSVCCVCVCVCSIFRVLGCFAFASSPFRCRWQRTYENNIELRARAPFLVRKLCGDRPRRTKTRTKQRNTHALERWECFRVGFRVSSIRFRCRKNTTRVWIILGLIAAAVRMTRVRYLRWTDCFGCNIIELSTNNYDNSIYNSKRSIRYYFSYKKLVWNQLHNFSFVGEW